MTISNELLDSLLADYQTPEDLIGEGGLLKQLVERALQTEMVEHRRGAESAAGILPGHPGLTELRL